MKSCILSLGRGVAQLGSALGSGPRGREFKSPLPDHLLTSSLDRVFAGDVPKQALGSGHEGDVATSKEQLFVTPPRG